MPMMWCREIWMLLQLTGNAHITHRYYTFLAKQEFWLYNNANLKLGSEKWLLKMSFNYEKTKSI